MMMVARIEGFHSRLELGMRSPRSRSTNITPQHGGLAVHWGGPRQTIDSHDQCKSTWISWQNYHMNGHGWVDIAYSFGFCNHGYVFAGRGFGIRTAANGTNYGNQNFYAAVWIGGSGNAITGAAYDALDWLIVETRKNAAGSAVRDHGSFTGSECPGAALRTRAGERNNRVIATETIVPIPKPAPIPDADTDFESWWNTLDKPTQDYLEAFAKRGLELGPAGNPSGTARSWGQSLANQTYIMLREERPFLTQIIGHVIGKGSNMQGFVRGSINLFRAAKDDYKVNTL